MLPKPPCPNRFYTIIILDDLVSTRVHIKNVLNMAGDSIIILETLNLQISYMLNVQYIMAIPKV